jgi:hypothetical protein
VLQAPGNPAFALLEEEGREMSTTAKQWEMFDDEETLAQKFWEFEKANPHVYKGLVVLARKAQARGIEQYSVDALFHVLRWEMAVETSRDEDEDPFRLNNNYTSFYARLIMDREPDLKGFFELRVRKAR